MKTRRALLFPSFLVLLLPFGAVYAEAIKISDIIKRNEARLIPIAIQSSVSEIRALAIKAFQTHGQYRLTGLQEAEVVLKLEQVKNIKKANTHAIEVELQSGDNKKTEVVRGKSWRKAVLRACDKAVNWTAGLRGYFAGKLVFIGERERGKELFISDLFFQRVQQLTHDRSHALLPKWSPNGHHILYTSYFHSGFPDSFLIDVETGQRLIFAAYKGINTGAVFNPRGTHVALILSSKGNPELYLTNKAGKVLHRLTRTKSIESSPTWSPDGRRLMVSSDLKGTPQLYEIDLKSGRGMRRIPIAISRHCTEPVWSPLPPERIAFTALVNRTFQIALYNASTRKSRLLTQGPGDHIEPRWTHDGRHLVCTQRNGRSKRLCLLDSETGKKTSLHASSFGRASQCDFIYPQTE